MLESTLRTLLRVLLAASLFAGQAPAQSRPGGSARSTITSQRSAAARGTTNRSNFGGTTRSTNGQRQYRSNTELGDAIIQIDPETRSLVIVTDEDTHRELVSVIKDLDRPKPQVLIKVVFLEITYNKGLDVGVEGMYTFNMKSPASATTRDVTTTRNSTTYNNGTTTTTATSTGSAIPANGTGSMFAGKTGTDANTAVSDVLTQTLGTAARLGQTAAISSVFGAPATGGFLKFVSDDWNATLHLLATKGKVNVLSRPSIMARNNQEAVIVVGQEVPFITNSRVTDQGQTINTIQYDNVGIILRVTPFITRENTVEMIVAPEISTLNTTQTVPISPGVNAPTIDKRSAETVVVTPHGQTVVIGGLMQTQKGETIQKIPILGDIPILGFPFRRTIRDDTKRELMIFLTPYIVNNAESLAQATSDEMARTQLPQKAFTHEELETFLDGLPLPSDGGKPNGPVATPIPVKKATPVKAKTSR